MVTRTKAIRQQGNKALPCRGINIAHCQESIWLYALGDRQKQRPSPFSSHISNSEHTLYRKNPRELNSCSRKYAVPIISGCGYHLTSDRLPGMRTRKPNLLFKVNFHSYSTSYKKLQNGRPEGLSDLSTLEEANPYGFIKRKSTLPIRPLRHMKSLMGKCDSELGSLMGLDHTLTILQNYYGGHRSRNLDRH